MIPRLKFDEVSSPKLEAGLALPSGQGAEGDGIEEIRGRAGEPRLKVQPDWVRPRFSWPMVSNLFRRHARLITIMTLLTFVVGAYGISTLKNQFTATVVLILDQSSARLLASENPAPLNVDAEAELLKSESIALRVIDQLQLTTNPEYAPKQGALSQFIEGLKASVVSALADLGLRNSSEEETPVAQDIPGAPSLPPEKASVLQMLKQNITIRRRGITDLLAVEAKAESPQLAAMLANAYAQAYLDEQLFVKAQAIGKVEEILNRQLSLLNEELKRSEAQVGLRQSYQETLSRLRIVAQKRDTLSPDARIVSPARPPRGPAFPSARLLGVVGLVFSATIGLGLAFAIAALRETNRRRAYTEDEVEAASGVANLGVLPRWRTGFLHRRGRHSREERSAEAVRRLFFNLQALDRKGLKVSSLLLTTSRSRQVTDGVGLSLARLAAASGLKVVVIDCNLRQPHLDAALDLNRDKGFVDLLLLRSDLSNLVQDDRTSECKFITAGCADAITIEKCLRPERLKNAMRKLRMEFDMILMLAPPMETSADPLILTNVADVALYVVRLEDDILGEIHANVQQLRRSSDNQVLTVAIHGSK